jgi:hypothetical protein
MPFFFFYCTSSVKFRISVSAFSFCFLSISFLLDRFFSSSISCFISVFTSRTAYKRIVLIWIQTRCISLCWLTTCCSLCSLLNWLYLVSNSLYSSCICFILNCLSRSP